MAAVSERDLDASIRALGEAIHQQMQGEVPSVFDRDFWQGRMLEWAMRDPDFKLDLFRFVDVLPMLKTRQQVVQHVREYLLKGDRELPGVVNVALKAAWGRLVSGLASRALRNHISEMAHRFIAAPTPEEALPVLRKLHRDGLGFTADLLGEATVSDEEVAVYEARYRDLIDAVSAAVTAWPEDALIDVNHLGPIPRANISVKVSALAAFLDPVNRADCVARLKEHLVPLCVHARDKNVFVNLDLEQWALHDITYDVFEVLATHPDLRDWPHLGIVVQAYLKSADRDVARLLALARSRATPLTVRLVKGAYWDYEVVHARQHGYACPVLTNKAATDAQFEHLSAQLIDNVDWLWPAIGSHNLRSVVHALAYAQERGLPKGAMEIQMLFGMAEPMRATLRAQGCRVRIYSPIGEMLPGMAYLVRRLLENTSNEGFLRQRYHEGVDLDRLLARPEPDKGEEWVPRLKPGDLDTPFENCAHADFTDEVVCAAFEVAIKKQRGRLPVQVPVVVQGRVRKAGEVLAHVCPSNSNEQATRIVAATPEDVDRAVEAAMAAWPKWRDRPLDERAMLLEKLADRLVADRFDLAALQTLETGKPWREADADVTEAVDFCRYYARRARAELGPRMQGDMWGEANAFWYEGRGPTAVIAPWNFPLAILCGMSVAALVAGNPVLMKPAEQSSAIAWGLFERMQAVGFPKEVVHFLPGQGEVIGRKLVGHPLVAQIAFTGSKTVGLEIVRTAGATKVGQPQVKRVVCEMGGKNAIVVDDDADLDEAVTGVLYSAFGYAGQKCSACSRVVVVEAVYEAFVSRLVAASKSLVMVPAHLPRCDLGPVIDEEAYARLQGVIANPGEGAKPLYVGEAPEGGFFVAPALFEVADADHRLMQEEFFGPVLALMHVPDFETALRVVARTEFALTGGVFSRSPSHLAMAKERFRVGNLYLNRGCTGSMVARQPFGGFGMSGMGSKSGGPGYLLQFAQPRSVSENTMRRGFTPEVAL